jgi:4-hydroxy-3-methylbut-2-enyl diphosphate reductase
LQFANATSDGFDPDKDLQAVGIANQTTMLKGETEEMGKELQRIMMAKYGVEKLDEHFMLLDTICDATQERQVSHRADRPHCANHCSTGGQSA